MRSIRLPSWSKRLLGLDPLPVPPHVFALEADRLRYGRFEASAGAFEFRHYHGVALPAELFGQGPLGGQLRDAEALGESLRTLLAESEAEVGQASLLLPDAWMRLLFLELDEGSASGNGLQEVLRWKLNKLVPFRVEELRLTSTPVASLPGQEESSRFLLAFSFEQTLAQIEDVFQSRGIRLGQIANESVALHAALESSLAEVEVGAFLAVGDGGYSLLCARHGEPAFYRFKALPGGGAVPWDLVGRDLRLTRGYLGEQLGTGLERLLLVCSDAASSGWLDCLQAAFEIPVVRLSNAHLRLKDRVPPEALPEIAPLFGAACREVA